MSEKRIIVEKIRIYPIKSARSILVNEVNVINGSMEFDRMFTIIDKTLNNKCLNQKVEGKMTRLQPFLEKIEDNKYEMTIRFYLKDDTFKELKHVSLEAAKNAEVIKTTFREKEVEFVDMGDEAASFLSTHLERNVRLVKQKEERSIVESINDDLGSEIDFRYFQQTKEEQEEEKEQPKELTIQHNSVSKLNLGNRSPISILTESTIDHINDNEENIFIPEENYRCNLILQDESSRTNSSSPPPYEEENWKQFKINNLQFLYVRGAPRRCVMTAIDQKEGSFNQKIIDLLREKHSIKGKIPDVGVLVCCNSSKKEFQNGIIRVGDQLIIEKTQEMIQH